MKNYFLLLALMGLIISSCGDDDEPSASPAELIIGTWDVTSLIFSDCLDPDDEDGILYNGVDNCESYGTDTYCENIELVFEENGVASSTYTSTLNGVIEDSDTDPGSYVFEQNGEVTLCFGDCVTGNLTLTESSFVFVGQSDGCTVTFRASK